MSGSKKILILVIVVAALVIAGIAAVLLANQSTAPGETRSPTNTEQQTQTRPDDKTSDQPEQKTYPVKVFFSRHPESDDDPGLTFPVNRTSPDLGVASFAISELIKGPSQTETNRGYFSYVKLRYTPSNCEGKDFTLSIKESVARLQFCRTFDHIGSVSDGQAESAIRATLMQFESVDKVVILNAQGSCEFDLSGENRCLQ